jgi:hypothetical protein
VPTSFEVRIQGSEIQRVLLSSEKYRFNLHLQSSVSLQAAPFGSYYILSTMKTSTLAVASAGTIITGLLGKDQTENCPMSCIIL